MRAQARRRRAGRAAPANSRLTKSLLTEDEMAIARAEGHRLTMDEAVRITRKAVEQLADR